MGKVNIRTDTMRRQGSKDKRSMRGHEGEWYEVLRIVHFHFGKLLSAAAEKCSRSAPTISLLPRAKLSPRNSAGTWFLSRLLAFPFLTLSPCS